jgi:peroxiredoxin
MSQLLHRADLLPGWLIIRLPVWVCLELIVKLLLPFLLAASVTANVFLGRQVVMQHQRLAAIDARPGIEIGQNVPALRLTSTRGETVTVDFGSVEVPTVLYILSQTCRWCDRNLASIQTLATNAGSRFRFVGVDVSRKEPKELAEYLRAKPLPFDVLAGLSDHQASQLRLRSTPTTIVVTPDGRVFKVWEGAYGGAAKRALEEYFGVSLPELAEGDGTTAR